MYVDKCLIRETSIGIILNKGDIMSINLIAELEAAENVLNNYTLLETGNPGVHVIPQFLTSDLLDPDVVRTHQLQRDHKKRLKKMQKHFQKKLPSLYNLSLMRIKKEFSGTVNGETITVTPGVDMVDGHTRREDWIKSSERGDDDTYVPNYVNVIVYDVDNFKQYKDIYYSFDSTDASEKTNEKIVGACRALNLVLNSTTAKSGSFGSALDIAYPGDRKDDILTKVSYFHKEIVELDKLGLFNPADPELKFQCLMAAALQALKIYSEPDETRLRLEGGLLQLAQARKDTLSLDPTHWYGMDLIQYEYFMTPDKEWSIPKGMHRKTSFSSINPQMDFIWYCFEMYMTKSPVKKNRGMKSSSYKGYYEKATASVAFRQPLVGYEGLFEDLEETL